MKKLVYVFMLLTSSCININTTQQTEVQTPAVSRETSPQERLEAGLINSSVRRSQTMQSLLAPIESVQAVSESINISSISLTPKTMNLKVSQAKSIDRIFVTLNDADGVTALRNLGLAEFSSSNPGIATVSGNGLVTAIKEGVAIITTKYKGFKDTLSVVVEKVTPSAVSSPTNNLKSISLSNDTNPLTRNEIRLTRNNTSFLRIFVTLNDDGMGVLNNLALADLSSSNTSVASVSADGVLTAKEEGFTTITATYKGLTTTLRVFVEKDSSNNLKSISIAPDTMTLAPNASASLRVFVTLNDADETIGALNNLESAELSSSNSSVATVSTSGVVTAKAKGVATITATYKTLKATLVVTVEEDS